MFTKAIVRKPCQNILQGLTSVDLGTPNFELALSQHENYVSILESCGLAVEVLEAREDFPDSTFVEDTAVCKSDFAILCNPGAKSRNKESQLMEPILAKYFQEIYPISLPGTIDGGDVMMVGNHFYIGLSQRTNVEGAMQFIELLEQKGCSGSMISLKKVLHLKTGVSYLENNNLLVSGEFINKPDFDTFNKLIVPEEESYAACSLWINGKVIVPVGFPKTKAMIEAAGYPTIDINVSEFAKVDGGLSCLSLRF